MVKYCLNEIYIGDNLAIMNSDKFKKYLNKIDFIYIDPPYNTKAMMSYEDKNDMWYENFLSRMKVAYEMLNVSGVVYIGIDDSELASVLDIGYKIFGKNNFMGLLITRQATRSNSKMVNVIHEYIVCFCKDKSKAPRLFIKRMENPIESEQLKYITKEVKKLYKKDIARARVRLNELIRDYSYKYGQKWIKNYNNIDESGRIYFAKDLSTPGEPRKVDIDFIGIHLEPLKTRGWPKDERTIKLYKENRLTFKNGRPYVIEYLDEATDNVPSILNFYSRQGTNDLKKLGLNGLFDTPKPVELIKFLIRSTLRKNGIILDFYAGSGTTAQAVYEINEEDCRAHQYILIQNEEKINEKSKTYKNVLKYNLPNLAISDLMLIRINRYLEINNKSVDFDVIKG